MGGADIGIAAVSGTEEKCLLPLVVVGGAVPQLTATVGAIEKPGEHTDNARSRGPAAVLAEILNQGKGFSVNDGGVGVGEYLPFLLGFTRRFRPSREWSFTTRFATSPCSASSMISIKAGLVNETPE